MCVLRGLVWNLHHFNQSIATNKDIGHDLLLTVILRNLACFGQRQMTSFEQYKCGSHLQNGSGKLLETIKILDIGLWLASFTHDEICFRDVGRDKISHWEEFVDEGLGGSFGEEL